MATVRFHLQRGPHYRMWQVKDRGEVSYYDPDRVSLVLRDCKLVNRRAAADRIHRGESKSVCAWVRCVDVEIVEPHKSDGLGLLCYNPRVAPHWRDGSMADLDNTSWQVILSVGRALYAMEGATDEGNQPPAAPCELGRGPVEAV